MEFPFKRNDKRALNMKIVLLKYYCLKTNFNFNFHPHLLQGISININ